MITLNIGLAVNGANPDLGLQVAKTINAIGEQFGFGAICKMKYSLEGSEPTLIILMKGIQSPNQSGNYWVDQLQHARFNLISLELGQDCIAVQDNLTGKGILIGPKADDWGPFNPEYFQEFTWAELLEAELLDLEFTKEGI